MTVKQLKEALDHYPDDMDVYLTDIVLGEYNPIASVEAVENGKEYILTLSDI